MKKEGIASNKRIQMTAAPHRRTTSRKLVFPFYSVFNQYFIVPIPYLIGKRVSIDVEKKETAVASSEQRRNTKTNRQTYRQRVKQSD